MRRLRLVARFYRSHRGLATTFLIAWLAAITAAVLLVHTVPDKKPSVAQVFGHDPNALANPQSGLPGGGFSPTPNDTFAPPDANAETYPGFPPGTRFLPGSIRDRLTVTSVQIALRFYRHVGLRSHCPDGHKIHRYVDPEKQTLARGTINGCDVFIDVNTHVPVFRKSWNAMGYCNLLVHEIGHNVGLQHSTNPQQIMYYLGNSRDRTGCERFAPENFGTVANPVTPPGVICAGPTAVRKWLGDDPTKAFELYQKKVAAGGCR